MGDVRRALAEAHPFGFLALASSLLASLDPRRADPFARKTPEPERITRDELLHTFVEVDRPETTALLAVMSALGSDELERRRLAQVVAARRHRLPAWLCGLGSAEVYRATEMVHVLGDGDNVLVGLRLAAGEELTAVVYIDHNVGTLVKDAFIVPDSIEAVLRLMRDTSDDPDTAFVDLTLADAKARIVDAIAVAAMTYPPFESDTWPACRPLVEWVTRLLPDGGRGYERPEWSDAEKSGLVERFFGSSDGMPLDDQENRALLDSILWFGCDYGPGDPLRWSTVAVEILLADWIPRKIVAEAGYLSKAPQLLRAFIRFCHAERGIPRYLTDETLEAVDRWEPAYQAAIRSPRLQGPAALLSAIGLYDDDDDSNEPWNYEALMLGYLERAVGGREALSQLDDAPLPGEPFDWTGVPADVTDRVAEVLALIDRCCEGLLDFEHRTACRRVLGRIAVNGPDVFRRRGRSETAAAAICWSVCRANDTFSQRRGGLTQKQLLTHFGLQGGSISPRARTLLDAGRFPDYRDDFVLGSPEYLVAERRRHMIARRDRLVEPMLH